MVMGFLELPLFSVWEKVPIDKITEGIFEQENR